MTKQEQKILIGLHRSVNRIDKESIRLFSKYDLTMGQFAVLEALYHKEDLTVGQVQQKILSTSGTIPVIIRNLEGRGYLVRLTDKKDKRRCLLHITAKGKSLIDQVYPQNEKLIVDMLAVLSEEEKIQLVSLLKKTGGMDNGTQS